MLGYAIQYDLVGKDFPRFYAKDSPEGSRLLELSNDLIDDKLKLLGKVNPLEAAEYVVQLFYDGAIKGQTRCKLEEAAIDSMISRIVDDSLTPQELLFINDPSFEEKVRHGASLAEAVAKADAAAIAAQNTMFAVSYLLSAEDGIRNAMSYNFDPLVQEHMLDLYGVEKTQIITHPGRWGNGTGSSSDVREIYHVHGFIPGQRHLDRRCDQIFPSSSGPLILSEDSYYRIEREEAYNWSSSIQSYFMNRYNCLFVGFSADDYNFRRIIRQCGITDNADPSHPHYLVLTIDDWIRDIYQDVCRTHIGKNSKIRTSVVANPSQDSILFLQYILESRADYWKRFGFIPIWVTVKDIPQLLTNLL